MFSVAVLGGEAQVLVEAHADVVAVEAVSLDAPLEQELLERHGHGGLARRRQAGHPHGAALVAHDLGAFFGGDVAFVPGDVGCFDFGH
jgi:hypothetical protein